jgi:glycosyltransferase involved in cell wall biosynthesis
MEIAFSVIIPLYNKAPYIKRALQSVLNQTVAASEIIVVDDGSNDNGSAVVMEINNPLIRLIQQRNSGVSVARNNGISEARFRFVAFLDADDEWKPCFLSTIHDLITIYPQAGAFATAYEMVEPDGKIRKPKINKIPKSTWKGILVNYFLTALKDPPLWTSATVVPKEVFSNIGKFRVGEKIGEDLDMWLRIAVNYKVAWNSISAARYYRDSSNRACNNQFTQNRYILVNSGTEVLRTIKNSKLFNARHLKEYITKYKIIAASQCIVSLNQIEARENLKNAFSLFFLKDFLWWGFWSIVPKQLLISIIHFKKFLTK